MVTDASSTDQPLPRWERIVGPVIDVVEDYVLDPIDVVVTPRVQMYQARATHRRVRRARDYTARRAVRTWRGSHRTRARLVTAWSGLETALEHTHSVLHQQHTGRLDNSDACCSGELRLARDRAELLRALATVEAEIDRRSPVRSPNLGAVPGRLRRIAGDRLEQMVRTVGTVERAAVARRVHQALLPEFGESHSSIEKQATAYRWVERARAWDHERSLQRLGYPPWKERMLRQGRALRARIDRHAS